MTMCMCGHPDGSHGGFPMLEGPSGSCAKCNCNKFSARPEIPSPPSANLEIPRVVSYKDLRQSGNKNWSITDEWNFISQSKMKALGINASFLEAFEKSPTMRWTPMDPVASPQAVEHQKLRRIHMRDADVGQRIEVVAALCRRAAQGKLPHSWLTSEIFEGICREFLIIGRVIGDFILSDKGEPIGLQIFDPDLCEVTPDPVKNCSPRVSVNLSSGRRDLDPNTLFFIARKTSPYDYVGTSCIPGISSKSNMVTSAEIDDLANLILKALRGPKKN